MSDDAQCSSDTEHETVYVEETPDSIFGNVLIDGPDGQCVYYHRGIDNRCPNDAVAHTFMSSGKKIEMCAEHVEGDVPEPESTEQQELVTDGGTVEDGTYQIACPECNWETREFETFQEEIAARVDAEMHYSETHGGEIPEDAPFGFNQCPECHDTNGLNGTVSCSECGFIPKRVRA